MPMESSSPPPYSLHLLHGEPRFVESFLSSLQMTAGGFKVISLCDAAPLDGDSMMALSLKICLRSLDNTALLLAFRKEGVTSLEKDLGQLRPLRYAVENMKAETTVASFEADAALVDEFGRPTASTIKLVVYVAPASRFSQLLKRAIPTLDKRVTKDNATHLVIAALPKEYDELKMQSGKMALATF